MDTMIRRIGKSEEGFTMIELVMVIVLVGIVAATVAMTMVEGTKSFEALDRKSDLNERGTLVVERMSRELRRIRCTTVGNSCAPQAADITNMAVGEIRFVNTGYEGLGFRYDAGSGTLWLRQGSGAGDPEDELTTDVSAFSLEYLKRDGTVAALVADVWIINASLTIASGAESVNLKASVHPRSFR